MLSAKGLVYFLVMENMFRRWSDPRALYIHLWILYWSFVYFYYLRTKNYLCLVSANLHLFVACYLHIYIRSFYMLSHTHPISSPNIKSIRITIWNLNELKICTFYQLALCHMKYTIVLCTWQYSLWIWFIQLFIFQLI